MEKNPVACGNLKPGVNSKRLSTYIALINDLFGEEEEEVSDAATPPTTTLGAENPSSGSLPLISSACVIRMSVLMSAIILVSVSA